jgi:hypothetical protein
LEAIPISELMPPPLAPPPASIAPTPLLPLPWLLSHILSANSAADWIAFSLLAPDATLPLEACESKSYTTHASTTSSANRIALCSPVVLPKLIHC